MKKTKHKLTPRQQEALKYILQGKNNMQISELMGITYGTAKLTCSNVLRKLGVSSKNEAMVMFLNS